MIYHWLRKKMLLDTCGMTVNFDRRSCKPSEQMSTPSIIIDPSAASIMRNRLKANEDFPAPVLPTIDSTTAGTAAADLKNDPGFPSGTLHCIFFQPA